MADFDNPLETWNARFAHEDFLFGEEPNAFLRAQAHWLRPSDSILCVADGEGRNSVWLAEQGYEVTAFDFAPNAVAKAKGLAQRRNVNVNHELGDAYTWSWAAKRYDALVAVFIQFLPPDFRDSVFSGMKSAVEDGGLFLLEGYRPEQVDYGTGGPPRREHMYRSRPRRARSPDHLNRARRTEHHARGPNPGAPCVGICAPRLARRTSPQCGVARASSAL
jgi:SAM-dependent methyltransferase